MIFVIFVLVCFGASVVGAICGIGGGVIIKPVLDAFGLLDVAVISFLSGCTVLSMTAYTFIKGKIEGSSRVDQKVGFPLAVGAAAGGLLGRWLFSLLAAAAGDLDQVGLIQSACLLAVTVGTLVYTIYKDKIRTCSVENTVACILIGTFLGLLSSFLGIGGGPVNLVVLYFFFSMSTKTAAENSLYIILFSQVASVASSVVTGSVPSFDIVLFLFMAAGGILGGISGRYINKKIQERTVEKLFILLMVFMIVINIYNIYKFS